MSLVRLLGFTTLDCGCVVGRYRELGTARDVNYVEEKGVACDRQAHRRNHTTGTDAERQRAKGKGQTLPLTFDLGSGV
jgi:hypothetical protein